MQCGRGRGIVRLAGICTLMSQVGPKKAKINVQC